MAPRRKAPHPGKEAEGTRAPAPFPGLPMGRAGTLHPPIGLGLWAMGRWTREDETRTHSALERALDQGLPWIDTAEVYGTGRSERMLGDALGRRPDGWTPPFLSTKVSWEHLHAAQVRASVRGSLQRLGRTSVDLYLVHAPDPRVPISETMGAMVALQKEGKATSIGVSNFSIPELEAAREAVGEGEVLVNQIRFNLFDAEDGSAMAPYCRKNGIVLEAYTPLARGLLTGRYLDREKPSEEVKRYSRSLFDEDRFQELRAKARALQELADGAGVPLPSIALHWLARQGAAPLFGASRPEQVDEVVRAWSQRPTDAVLDRAEAIAREGRA